MKKLLSILLALVMVLSLAACGNSEGSTSSPSGESTESASVSNDSSTSEADEENTTDSGDTIKIGVVLYDPADAEFLALKDYFDDYVGPGMNVEFMYSEAIADADGEINFINNCASSGCDVIMGYYNVSGVEAAYAAIDQGMYYIYDLSGEEGYEELMEEDMYLGGISYGENGDYEAGYAMGSYLKDLGVTKAAFSNGGADFGVPMFINRQTGFVEGLGDDAEVVTVSGFPGTDAFSSAQSSALTESGLEAVASSFNALSTWVQPISSASLDIPLVTIGAVTSEFVEAMENGQLDMLVAANIQRYSLQVAQVYQAMNGNIIRDDDGNAAIYGQGYWEITDAEECAALLDIQENERVYTVEELMSITSYADLVELAESFSLEDIQARRA